MTMKKENLALIPQSICKYTNISDIYNTLDKKGAATWI